jgi:hypothetical protein
MALKINVKLAGESSGMRFWSGSVWAYQKNAQVHKGRRMVAVFTIQRKLLRGCSYWDF